MNNQEELIGIVDRFLFQSNDNGFSVFILQTKSKEPITVTGHMPNIQPGQQVDLVGSWGMHPKFGKQFQATRVTASQPTSIAGLKKYLGSGLIKGVGPSYAEKLVNAFGLEVLDVIDKNPEKLLTVPGIGAGRMEKIIAAWKDQKDISKIMVFLQDRNISTTYAIKIYKRYGQDSIALITENPYRLVQDIWGIGFKTADTIAQNLGIAKDSAQRITAGILHCITTETSNGHLYVELQTLKEKTTEILELEFAAVESTIKYALQDLYNSDKIKVISHNQEHYVTLTKYYYSEKGVAEKITLLQSRPIQHNFDLDAIYAYIKQPRHENDIALNDEQQQGIMACVQNKVTVITGGPGTGKTTLIKKLLAVLDEANVLYKLAAPTGRAAKRITEGTGRPATTIHRLLEFDFTNHGFKHNEQNALQLHFLIVDEASMIDIFLAYAIIRALPHDAHLILIGDVDQLPSVGAGNFLHDLIASNKIATIRLQQIFRQAQNSLIIVNAHKINKGEFPTTFLPDSKQDFFFIKEELPEQLPVHLERIFTSGLKKYGITSDNAIVLTPMNRGGAGTQKINHDIQLILNPATSGKQIPHRGAIYKINDRVMQIRNNYDKNVFNGDIGTIYDINTEDRIVFVAYDQRVIEYEFSELDELVLAYAITIHKSQGSEYSAVIIPIFMQHFMMLQRNLIYTAVTRAKKLCIFIGQAKALAVAIKNSKGVERKTFLYEFLTSPLQCR
ncbi:MAG TPA: ATP-dependent RecD-like DNA helicase [Candidatus Babeliales bacterium]|nr:ATP-dependent RecD-like DNA helicase [Candidatus Babeliales bacterium]